MTKENNNNILLIVAGLIVVIMIVAFAGLSMQPKEVNVYNTGEENLNLLSVNSTVTKNYQPDRAEIVISVETLDKNAQISQRDNAGKAENVINALKENGIKDSEIETISYSVREEYEWNDFERKSISVGYKTNNTIKITLTDLTITGKVVDVAVSAGANNVSNIAFTLSEVAQQEAKNQALKEAAEFAKIKANSIAQGLGVSVGKVHSISENSYYYTPNYYSYDAVLKSSEAGSQTPISTSDVSVTATVTVQFEI